ncbi:hypothetical protein TRVA0_002S04434 [Trichomonascus vanleenenianus]|uniref:uncharacterized protein n=1 Tax=Trichomonascus vanleenenianus TaxID=2268995 RepID=UPI003EC9FC70
MADERVDFHNDFNGEGYAPLDNAQLWDALLIEYDQTQLRYTSEIDPSVVFRVQLGPQAQRDAAKEHNMRIVRGLTDQAAQRHLRRVEWRLKSAPPIDTRIEAQSLFSALSLGQSIGIERLLIDVSEEAADYLCSIMEVRALANLRFCLVLRCEFLRVNSPLLRVLDHIGGIPGWQDVLELHLRANYMTQNAEVALRRFGPCLATLLKFGIIMAPVDPPPTLTRMISQLSIESL